MIIILLKRNDFLFKVIYYEIFLILLFIKKYSSLSLVARSFLMSTLCDMNAVILVLSEKAMAPHSSTLAWKLPWTEEPGRLQSMGSGRVRRYWAASISLFTFMHWRRKWQSTPAFLPGESRGWRSLVGCCLWGCTESDTTEATQQQQHTSSLHLTCDILKILIFLLSTCMCVKSSVITFKIHLLSLVFIFYLTISAF